MRKIITTAVLLVCAVSSHANDHKARVMPDDRETPNYVLGTTQQKWPLGVVLWYYNPTSQPASLSTETVVNAIKVAADRWSGMCNVRFRYMGTTTNRPYGGEDSFAVDRRNVVGWDLLKGEDSDAAAITYSWSNSGVLLDADIAINTDMPIPWTAQRLDGVLTHEIGHMVGIKHSNTVDSVMSADPYNSFAYMRVLRGDDAKGCAALYGAADTATSNRTFNWAEEAYPEFIAPGPSVSGTFEGYYYRYYPGTNTYLGSRNGTVYFMGPTGLIYDVGTLDYYSPWVTSWGY
ncbi:matrixin family metalloprotease [Rhodoferax sp. AJA081-3]|uniref:matrixin family metalloprotease n=1 Tax=Rhodoferax sp. AJA081-3 TaxID=2752316 RepID=UPI001ADF1F27|nr:matrixin family metalloprotease [Rhodoferax sp. AJA081-3]QTN29055.1 matrixin family metalloprotease [Rhodoferax sp. AJA081-3]